MAGPVVLHGEMSDLIRRAHPTMTVRLEIEQDIKEDRLYRFAFAIMHFGFWIAGLGARMLNIKTKVEETT